MMRRLLLLLLLFTAALSATEFGTKDFTISLSGKWETSSLIDRMLNDESVKLICPERIPVERLRGIDRDAASFRLLRTTGK